MPDVTPICRALEFIEAHLRDDITVAEMASVAGYSLYHFARVFNRLVQHTPYNYLMRRRLSEAARDLLNSERRVLEIALDYRFNNHETFSRAFKRLFAVQPVVWRENACVPYRTLMPALTLAHLEYFSRSDFEHPQQVVWPQRYLAGLMAPLHGDRHEIMCLWEILEAMLGNLSQSINKPDFYGLTIHAEKEAGTSFYMVAVEVPSLEFVPAALVAKILPAGSYLKVRHNAPIARLSLALDYVYHVWLPKAKLISTYPMELVHFGYQLPGKLQTKNSQWTVFLPLS